VGRTAGPCVTTRATHALHQTAHVCPQERSPAFSRNHGRPRGPPMHSPPRRPAQAGAHKRGERTQQRINAWGGRQFIGNGGFGCTPPSPSLYHLSPPPPPPTGLIARTRHRTDGHYINNMQADSWNWGGVHPRPATRPSPLYPNTRPPTAATGRTANVCTNAAKPAMARQVHVSALENWRDNTHTRARARTHARTHMNTHTHAHEHTHTHAHNQQVTVGWEGGWSGHPPRHHCRASGPRDGSPPWKTGR
jgi:hypothetical protein